MTRSPRRRQPLRARPPATVLVAAGLVTLEGALGVMHSAALLLGSRRPGDVVGLAWIRPPDAGPTVAVPVFLLSVGLLLAAVFLLLHSRFAEVYALAVQALTLLDAGARLLRGFPSLPPVTLLLLVATAGLLLLPSLRRWCDVPLC